MIVLDEQLLKPQVAQDIARWYRGRISNIIDLRPGTRILDDAVATLLQTVSDPTFVTINYDDFWEVIPARSHYCVVCLRLHPNEWAKVSPLVREVLNLTQYKTNRLRMGCVISVRNQIITDYCV